MKTMLAAALALTFTMVHRASGLIGGSSPISCSTYPLHSAPGYLTIDTPSSGYTVLQPQTEAFVYPSNLTDSKKRPFLAISRKGLDDPSPYPSFDFYPCGSYGYNWSPSQGQGMTPGVSGNSFWTEYYGQLRYDGKCVTVENTTSTLSQPFVLDTCQTADGSAALKQYWRIRVNTPTLQFLPFQSFWLKFTGQGYYDSLANGNLTFITTTGTIKGQEVLKNVYKPKGGNSSTYFFIY